MSKRKIYNLVVPTITFFLGIIFQILIEQWITFKDVISFAMIVIIVSLAFIFTAALTILDAIEKRFNTIDGKLDDMAARTGLRVEFIRDNIDGNSYRRSAQLIEKAKVSLTFVAPWQPFGKYQADASMVKLRKERKDYYEAIKRQVDRHKNNDEVFHRRIIQIPRWYEGQRLPFENDQTFYNYLKYVADTQIVHPHSCLLKSAEALIDAHFTIVDNRYVVMPIFGYVKNERQVRYGTLIFDDGQGSLVDCLNSIYKALEAHSQPIYSQQLRIPSEKE